MCKIRYTEGKKFYNFTSTLSLCHVLLGKTTKNYEEGLGKGEKDISHGFCLQMSGSGNNFLLIQHTPKASLHIQHWSLVLEKGLILWTLTIRKPKCQNKMMGKTDSYTLKFIKICLKNVFFDAFKNV